MPRTRTVNTIKGDADTVFEALDEAGSALIELGASDPDIESSVMVWARRSGGAAIRYTWTAETEQRTEGAAEPDDDDDG